jgi:hypothetical protein
MHSCRHCASRSRRRPGIAKEVRSLAPPPRPGDCGGVACETQSGSFRRLTATTVLLLVLLISSSTVVVVQGTPPTIQDPPLAPPVEETDSFMGVHIGSLVRVKCTAPPIELNNATLIAVTRTTITVASSNGDRFHLPKESTVIEAPVNWQRTTTITNDQQRPPRSAKSGWSWMWFLLLPAGAGAAGWFWLARRREAAEGETETVNVKKSPARGRLVLAAAPPPATALPNRAETVSDTIDALVESRCYGTAIERLEEQIKLKPDEFALRLQLLNVYTIIGNRKQVDRVLHQIEFHPDFSAEQKEKARQSLATSKDKAGKAAPLPAASGQATPAAAQSVIR